MTMTMTMLTVLAFERPRLAANTPRSDDFGGRRRRSRRRPVAGSHRQDRARHSRKNNGHARRETGRRFAGRNIRAEFRVDPGSGKTSLLRGDRRIEGSVKIAVIEGDQQTSNDAQRIRAAGAPAVQINHRKGCHIDAHMWPRARPVEARTGGVLLSKSRQSRCPAAFDLGKRIRSSCSPDEARTSRSNIRNVAASDLLLLNKSDLCRISISTPAFASPTRSGSIDLQTLIVSAKTGEACRRFTPGSRPRGAAPPAQPHITRRRKRTDDEPRQSDATPSRAFA